MCASNMNETDHTVTDGSDRFHLRVEIGQQLFQRVMIDEIVHGSVPARQIDGIVVARMLTVQLRMGRLREKTNGG